MRILQHCFRTYVGISGLDDAVWLYEALQGLSCERRVSIPETDTVAAKVGRFLVLSGDKAVIDKVREVDAIFYVNDLDAFADWAPSHGVEIVHGTRAVTGGRNFTARHPDGFVAEYFEARP